MNRIRAIQERGQSLWYDNIRRGLIESGELATLISQGITGITSNPTIFEKAIDGSKDYDAAIAKLSEQGLDVDQIYDALVLDDIGRGADLLLPVYNHTKGHDGYISIEVPPTLAADTDATIREAHRLFSTLKRPNIMIKVPATEPGIPAIRRLIADGINVNVTLIFSLDAYRDVMGAYLDGLEDRAAHGLPVDRIASVASFFVSRVDTLVDRLIGEVHADADLKGKAAIANAKLAYQLFLEHFQSDRFQRLQDLGAMVQRPLWASTSTKNPQYPDLLYVEALIGPNTVDTLPPATVQAILDHGQSELTLDRDLKEAHAVLDKLEAAGISMKSVTDQLLKEGVASFHQSFVTLKESLANKLGKNREVVHMELYLGAYVDQVKDMVAKLNHDRAISRLWEHDASLWSDQNDHQNIIANALGWLDVPTKVLEDAPNLRTFFQQAILDGFEHAVVLGMGGSSLVSDVMTHSFSPGRPGMALTVLDTTNAWTIDRLTKQLSLAKTLFIVASKSGTTTEPNAFYHYFWDVLDKQGVSPQHQFIAITDPGTAMEREAKDRKFRHIFLNPADIGGRYSALSWFGMVPATLHGIDVPRLLQGALAMREASKELDVANNPGAHLGAVLGALAKNGRDKVTFIMPEAISHLSDWLEQLLAESTGKLGTGLVPVAHEPFVPGQSYSPDRVFVVYQWQANRVSEIEPLVAAGHPVIVLTVDDPYQLGQEFFRWEVATAIAGAVLQIDAFDQPNVQESKDNTKSLIKNLDHGRLPSEELFRDEQGLLWTSSPNVGRDTLKETLEALLKLAAPSSYIALMTYIDQTPQVDQALADWRRVLLEKTRCAVTLGYGPRFLHSTGQLHKGGPDNGLYIQLVSAKGPRLPIARDGYDFMTLLHAQALGDFQSLIHHGRSVVRILINEPAAPQIQTLTAWAQPTHTPTEVQ